MNAGEREKKKRAFPQHSLFLTTRTDLNEKCAVPSTKERKYGMKKKKNRAQETEKTSARVFLALHEEGKNERKSLFFSGPAEKPGKSERAIRAVTKAWGIFPSILCFLSLLAFRVQGLNFLLSL